MNKIKLNLVIIIYHFFRFYYFMNIYDCYSNFYYDLCEILKKILKYIQFLKNNNLTFNNIISN